MFQEVKPRPPQTFFIKGGSGDGKTHTALRLARALVGDDGIIAAIDVGERESMVGYGLEKGLGAKYIIVPITKYGWDVNFTVKAIGYAKKHADVVVVDSLSNVWQTILSHKESVLDRQYKNSYVAWAEAGRVWLQVINAMRDGVKPAIATIRSKMSHVLEKDKDGKNVPVAIGLQPMTRDGVEYEFDIQIDMHQRVLSVVQPRHHMALAGLVLPEPTIDDLKIFRYELGVTHGEEG